MDVFLSITAFLCCLVGIVGCIVPVLPGPVLSYAGLWAGLTAAVTAADYFLPGYMAKLFGGTRAGMVGATVGMIAGLFVGGLIGIVVGPFVGAVVGELLNDRERIGQALVVGVGSFLSFLVGTGIKLVAAVGMLTFVVADTWPALRAWFATVF